MLEFYVATNEQLEVLCRQLDNSAWLAIDTEFIRENTYYPEFCLLQIANDSVAACVDPLAVDDLSELLNLIYDPNIVKVFHAARQDLEIFYHTCKKLPPTVFDTQLAATLTGLGDQPGYAAAVKATLGIELDKAQVRTNWRKRPLDDRQIRYALNDVIYLGQLYQKLIEHLSRLGRADWLDEDMKLLSAPATYRNPPNTQWKRIRGRQKLGAKQLAVLQELGAWRENRAIEENKPRQWIISNENLLLLARRMPKDLSQMQRKNGLDKKFVDQYGKELLTCMEEVSRTPASEWPQVTDRAPRLTPRQEAVADLLMCTLRVRAAEHNINPTSIASRGDIEKLAAGERSPEVLTGWRLKVAGKDLLRVLEGQLYPEIRSGHLNLVEVDPGYAQK